MERTLIQLKSDFADMADKHKQIQSFFWGDFVDAISRDAVNYPLMVCTLVPSQIGDSYTGVDLQVIICDKYLEQDYRIINEVHSDMLRILKDIDITLKQFRFQDYLDLETDLSTEPFINRGHDISAGWSGIFRMRIHDYENRCAIPYDGFDFDGSTTGTGCPEGIVVITDDEGNTLYTVTVDSNGNETQIIQDSTAVLKDSAGTILSTTSINAESSEDITAPDATYTVQYENGTLIEQGTIPSGGSVTVEVPDVPTCDNATWELRDTDNNLLDSGSIASGGSATITAPDGTVSVQNSQGNTVDSGVVLSGGSEVFNAPDADISLNGISFPSIPSGGSDNIQVRKSSGATQIGSKQGQYWRIANSPITVNSDAYTDLPATDSLNIPIVDSNGDAVNTTVVGSDVQVDDLPCSTPTDEWIRPADWLDMPNLESTDDEIALLHAVWDNDSNFAALRCTTTTGDYQVDWGDGTTTTHASNTVAEHQYDYSTYDTGGATLSSRGYKQAMIRITPLTGGLATFTTNVRYTGQNQPYVTGYLDVLLSMPNASAGQSIFFAGSLVANRYMEQVEILNSGGLSSVLSMFLNCSSLQSVPLFDTSSVTTMGNMFQFCSSLQSVPLFDTSSVTNMQTMFGNCSSLQSVPLFDTSSVAYVTQMFVNCSSLQSVPLFNTSSVLTFNAMFQNCSALQEIPPMSTISVTASMGNFARSCSSFSKTDIICRTSVVFFSCQLSRDGIVNLFNNLIDLTGLTSQNINLQGNYGVSDLSTADLEIATDKNWTVTI